MDILNSETDHRPGIYEIKNIKNNKRYIGQSQDLYVRSCKHFSNLNNGVHPNKHLQASWNKYGSDNFVINILEYCDIGFQV